MSCSRTRKKTNKQKNPESSRPNSNSQTADYIQEAVGQDFLVITAQAIRYK